MATADTARLIASLELQDKFSKTADKALTKVDRIDKRLGAFSGAVNRNLARGVDAVISKGVRALTSSVTEGLGSLAELENATTAVDGAIEATGKTGKVTATEIATWANEIEAATQAAFDDKAITNATATLLRYGKVTSKNIRPAMEVMTDLAARTGDVDSAATLLAKALADPTKAAGKLARQGVILTKQQQKQIKAFVEAGEKGKAQGVILDALADTTGGAAADSVGKYGDAIHLMADASEDAKKALAEGFFPVIQRVSQKITELANDPATIERLRAFGRNLANVFDKAIDIAEDVDWKSMGDGLKVAAGWAQRLWDAFSGAPTEVKGMLISLAGLSKLTGGAPIKFALDLGKDALGGIFGHFFDRGASPANPMWVQQIGTGPGGLPVPGGGKVPVPSGVIKPAIGAAVVFPIAEFHKQTVLELEQKGILKNIEAKLPKVPTKGMIPGPPGGGRGLPNRPGAPGGGARSAEELRKGIAGTKKATEDVGAKVGKSQGVLDQSILRAREAIHQGKTATVQAVGMGALGTSIAARGAGAAVSNQSVANTNRIVAGMRGLPVPIVTVNTYVSGTQVRQTQTITSRQSTYGSRTDDNYDAHR